MGVLYPFLIYHIPAFRFLKALDWRTPQVRGSFRVRVYMYDVKFCISGYGGSYFTFSAMGFGRFWVCV
jgi:hypothetical protein